MSKNRKALTLFDDYYEMMSDQQRMAAFDEAIRRVVRAGDTVIDLGAGLGILSFLALRAGASHVFAIEKGDSIDLMKKVAEVNGLTEQITFIRENSKQVTLPNVADVLLSETLGSFGVDENTLEFTIDARRRLLRADGKLLPSRLRLFVTPVQYPEAGKRANFWKHLHGFDYGPALDEIRAKMSLMKLDESQVLSEPQLFAAINLATVESSTLRNEHRFVIQRDGLLEGLAGWFEVLLCDGVGISTSPSSPPTHWQQAFFPFREALEVRQGHVLDLVLEVESQPGEADGARVTYDYYCHQKE